MSKEHHASWDTKELERESAGETFGEKADISNTSSVYCLKCNLCTKGTERNKSTKTDREAEKLRVNFTTGWGSDRNLNTISQILTIKACQVICIFKFAE